MPGHDIEIYLKETPAAAILEWLHVRFPAEPAAALRPAGKRQWRTEVEHEGKRIPVLLIEEAAPGFTTLWVNSAHTPWADDVACAREAHARFGTEIRATPGSWRDGDDPDAWWSIAAEGEKLIHWPG